MPLLRIGISIVKSRKLYQGEFLVESGTFSKMSDRTVKRHFAHVDTENVDKTDAVAVFEAREQNIREQVMPSLVTVYLFEFVLRSLLRSKS